MENKSMIGHIAALITIVIWGTTFISTKILLVDFQPWKYCLFVLSWDFWRCFWSARGGCGERI